MFPSMHFLNVYNSLCTVAIKNSVKLEHGTWANLDPSSPSHGHSNMAPEHTICYPLHSKNCIFCADSGILICFNILLLCFFCYFPSPPWSMEGQRWSPKLHPCGAYDFKPDFNCPAMLEFVWWCCCHGIYFFSLGGTSYWVLRSNLSMIRCPYGVRIDIPCPTSVVYKLLT